VDEESRTWVRDLRADGPVRDEAVARLQGLLLRAARFEVARRRPSLPHVRGEELVDIALEAADDALMSVLRRLDDFRGASRFTTWAYKFALLEAAVKLRNRAWQGREVPLERETWSLFSSAGLEPDAEAEHVRAPPRPCRASTRTARP
jgi:RNA polymerase sigma-70 factor (ECF subfamily)